MTDRLQRSLGARLREVRTDAGLTQAQLAAALGLTQAAISGWESGARQPSVADVYALAEALETDVVELLPPTGRARRTVRAALRAVADQLDQADLAAQSEKFLDVVETVARPEKRLSSKMREPEALALDLLDQLRISKPPVDVEAVAMACGVPVVYWQFPEALSGLVVEADDGAVIGVNEGHHPHRRRFSISHELGHVVLRHLDTFHVDLGAAQDGTPPGYNWRHERAANDFAAALLMPRPMLETAFAKTPHVPALARRFDVSDLAMGFRLKNLELR